MSQIEVLTLSNLVAEKQNETLEKIYCTRIGKIKQKNDDGSFSVELLEKIQYKNQQIVPFISSCFVAQNHTKTNGFVIEYNVGDVVLVQFTDIDYRQLFIDKNANRVVFDKENDKELLHIVDHGTIIGAVALTQPPIQRGIFFDDSVVGFDKSKIKIATKTNNITELFDKIMTLIDSIVALNGTIISPAGPCTFPIDAFNALKTEINTLKDGLFTI